MEAEIAAGVCRSMRYTTPNRAAMALLPAQIRTIRRSSRPRGVLARVELLRDIGPATVLYNRLWTEIKTVR